MKKRQATAVLITDTHLKPNNIELNKSVYQQACEIAQRYDVEYLFHAGDIFESRKSQTQELLCAFRDILVNVCLNYELKLVAIPGNHDKYNYSSLDSYLDPFMYWPNFLLYREPGFLTIGNTRYHFVPFILEGTLYNDLLFKAIDNISSDHKNVLITHIAVDGAVNNDGSQVSNGISKDDLNQFDRVLVGHYHNKHDLSSKIHYFGSTMPHNFGEDGDKGIVVLYNDGTFEYETCNFPQYLNVTINLEDTDESEVKHIMDKYNNSDDYVKFHFVGSRHKFAKVDTSSLKDNGFKIAYDEEIIPEEEARQQMVAFDASKIKAEFAEFCKLYDVEFDDLLKNLLKQL